MSSLIDYWKPDPKKFKEGVDDLSNAVQESLSFLTDRASISKVEGTHEFQQNPFYACWTNVPLCLGVWCIPCCNIAVYLRNMERMTGRSCESNCIACCALNCCCLLSCYHAQAREKLRKKYDLKGSPLMDLLLSCCCGACLTCQEGVELQHQDKGYIIPYASPSDAEKATAMVNDAAQKAKSKVAKDGGKDPENKKEGENTQASAGAPAQPA